MKSKINDSIKTIDITPPNTIYEIFKNLTYHFETALAEFIDNSTQSYKNNHSLVENKISPKIFLIFYFYKDNWKIQILDNCFGIDNSNLERVLKLNIKPYHIENSRNEYGMGLKTAAFWFGKKIIVHSKNLNENWTTIFNMSLDSLNKPIEVKYEDQFFFKNNYLLEFGTIIELNNLYKDKIFTEKSLKKMEKIFSSKYRQDIESGLKLHIIKVEKFNNKNEYKFLKNGEFFQVPSIFDSLSIDFYKHKFKYDETINKELKIEINDYFVFDEKKYRVSGIIGILEKGSRSVAGLTLFRRGRSILGDEDGKKYKPYKIFKEGAAFEFQRIYGYLDVNDFDVYQAKDGFKWENGLEDKFIDFLFDKITNNDEKINLIKISKRTKEKEINLNIESEILNSESAEEIKESINDDNYFECFEMIFNNENKDFYLEIIDKYGNKISFILEISTPKENGKYEWLEIQKNNSNNSTEYKIILDISANFFSPFNNDVENVKYQMIKFCIYFAYSEIIHSKICQNGSHQRKILNDLFLEKKRFIKE